MNIVQIKSFLSQVIFSVSGQSIRVGDLILIPTVIIFGLLLTKWTVKLLTLRLKSKETDPNIIHLAQRIVTIICFTILILTTLDLMNVPLAAFAFLSGAIAIGFGFGAQNIINNFISGWILMWERPIRIGDFLEVETATGIVEEINTRSTRIRRVDGVHLLIPNSKLLENTVVNWTLVDKLVRSHVKVGVAYGSPVKKVAELILEAANATPQVLQDPLPVVTFEDFGDNSLAFELTFWVESNVERGIKVARSDIRFRIDELFAKNEIVIAFPQRDIHLDGSLKLIRQKD